MPLEASLSSNINYEIEINNTAGRLQTSAPITLRNTTTDVVLADINTIGNVSEVNKVDGATLQYNSSNQNYEVRLAYLDGGSF